MNKTRILELFKGSMCRLKEEDASKLANIVNELDGLTYNDALSLLENVKFVLNNSKINLH